MEDDESAISCGLFLRYISLAGPTLSCMHFALVSARVASEAFTEKSMQDSTIDRVDTNMGVFIGSFTVLLFAPFHFYGRGFFTPTRCFLFLFCGIAGAYACTIPRDCLF